MPKREVVRRADLTVSGVVSGSSVATPVSSHTHGVEVLEQFTVTHTNGEDVDYTAGIIRANNVVTVVAAGSLTLTLSATNYVEVSAAGVVSANTTGFSPNAVALAEVDVDAGEVTDIRDKRTWAVTGRKRVFADKVTTYPIVATDWYVRCVGTFTATLPPAGDVNGLDYIVSNRGGGTITVDGDSGELIDGQSSVTVTQVLWVVSDGTGWNILSQS